MRYTRRLALAGIALGAVALTLFFLWQNAPSQDGQPASPAAEGVAAPGEGDSAGPAPARLAPLAPAAPERPAAAPERRIGSMPNVLPVRRVVRAQEPVSPAAPGEPSWAPAAPAAAGPAVPANRAIAPDEKDPGRIANCQLTLLAEADIPAQEAGVLKSLKGRIKDPATGQEREVDEVKEGLEVSEGDFLGQIDDMHVQRALEIAEAKLRAAQKEAGNDVNVRYAEAKAKVAHAEIKEAEATNEKAPGTVTIFELRRLNLAYNEAYLQIEAANHELGIAKEKENVSTAELAAAKEDINRRKIVAPWNGMIVQRYRRVGEWVKPGDPVFQVVRLDRLRIQAFLDADKIAPPEVDRQPVTVSVTLAHGVQRTFQGRIVHVNPKIENDGRFLIHAEVVNEKDRAGYWLLRPGQKGEMRIELKRG